MPVLHLCLFPPVGVGSACPRGPQRVDISFIMHVNLAWLELCMHQLYCIYESFLNLVKCLKRSSWGHTKLWGFCHQQCLSWQTFRARKSDGHRWVPILHKATIRILSSSAWIFIPGATLRDGISLLLHPQPEPPSPGASPFIPGTTLRDGISLLVQPQPEYSSIPSAIPA